MCKDLLNHQWGQKSICYCEEIQEQFRGKERAVIAIGTKFNVLSTKMIQGQSQESCFLLSTVHMQSGAPLLLGTQQSHKIKD